MVSALKPMDGFTFGADPEMFLENEKGEVVPACGLIPGTKEEPFAVKGGSVQVDGTAAEIGIDPSTSFEEFNSNIIDVMKELKAMLPKGYKLRMDPAVEYTPEVFATIPDEAKVLGCDTDYNAWTGQPNRPPDTTNTPYLRTAAGHLHIGWTKDATMDNRQHLMNCKDLVKQLDWYLGIWSCQYDTDTRRRQLYGKAGAYRPKPYGVEYRVLSNFWLGTKEMRLDVWNRMIQAIADMRNIYMPERVPQAYNQLLADSINASTTSAGLSQNFSYPVTTISSRYR